MENNFKYSIFNNLIITTNNKSVSISCSDFILKVIGYKPGANFILSLKVDDIICPILNIFKALLYINIHSFKLDENVQYYISKAKEDKLTFNKKLNIKLEDWEDNLISILDNHVQRKSSKVKELLIQNAKNNPKDLLSFKLGMVIGLYSGDKDFLSMLSSLSYHEDNLEDPHFIGIYAFIKEELREFSESEKWVVKGLSMSTENIWLQHVLAHVMYQTDRIDQSIEFMVSKKPLWDEHCNNFLNKHLKWHLAICYLEKEDFGRSNELFEEIINCPFEESECLLSILGYIMRAFIITDGNLAKINYSHQWTIKIIKYLNKLEIYTNHVLFDTLAVWFLSYVINQTTLEDKSSTEILLEKVMKTINENINCDIIEESDKSFYRNSYLNLLKAMILFGELENENAKSLFAIELNSIWKVGASDEQLLVLFEVALYCSYKTNDLTTFTKIFNEVHGENFQKENLFNKMYSELKS